MLKVNVGHTSQKGRVRGTSILRGANASPPPPPPTLTCRSFSSHLCRYRPLLRQTPQPPTTLLPPPLQSMTVFYAPIPNERKIWCSNLQVQRTSPLSYRSQYDYRNRLTVANRNSQNLSNKLDPFKGLVFL